jgi:hypothetical protein
MITCPALGAIPAKSIAPSNDVPMVCSPCTSHCLCLLLSSWIQHSTSNQITTDTSTTYHPPIPLTTVVPTEPLLTMKSTLLPTVKPMSPSIEASTQAPPTPETRPIADILPYKMDLSILYNL